MRHYRYLTALATFMLTTAPVAALVQHWPCNGSYSGVVSRSGQRLVVTLNKVPVEALSSYASVEPNTGGNRVFVYFDTDKAIGAEYNLFIYKDRWTLRKQSRPGLYGVEIQTGPTKKLKSGHGTEVRVAFDGRLLKGKINRCWNFHMK